MVNLTLTFWSPSRILSFKVLKFKDVESPDVLGPSPFLYSKKSGLVPKDNSVPSSEIISALTNN